MPRRVIFAVPVILLACSKDPPKSEPTTTSASASAAPSAASEVAGQSKQGVPVQDGDCALTVPKTPGVANADVMFASLKPRVRTAYLRGLQEDGTQTGTYKFTASIGADGKVAKVDATGTGLSKSVVGAMDQIVKGAQFDVGGKPATVSGSIDCRPK